MGFAVLGEDGGDAFAGGGYHEIVGVGEAPAELRGDGAAYGRLAAAGGADEEDALGVLCLHTQTL